MKKAILFVLFSVLTFAGVAAQDGYKTIKGYVVDKNGAPISGAEVSVPGGGETVYTDADGSFTMNVHPLLKKLTAKYAGMGDKTLKTNFDSDMVFTMNPFNPHPGFLSVLGGYTHNSYDSSDSFGSVSLMGGRLGKWGYYARIMSDFEDNYSVTIGAIKSIKAYKWFTYFGAGYAHNYYFNYDYYPHDDVAHSFALDFGFICRASKHFNVTFGINGATDFDDVHTLGVNLGVGYVF